MGLARQRLISHLSLVQNDETSVEELLANIST